MVDGGWRVARATLANERLSIGGNPVTLEAAALLDLLSRHTAVDDGVLCEAGLLLGESQTLHALNLQQIDRALAGAEPGPEGNIAKIVVGEHSQRVVNLGMQVAGLAGCSARNPPGPTTSCSPDARPSPAERRRSSVPRSPRACSACRASRRPGRGRPVHEEAPHDRRHRRHRPHQLFPPVRSHPQSHGG
ncbi:acyl-CoA dehydrogenase family protein [Frankia sp. QA3]|uniref:acyl-CoA dehydrogenase family protein n=1 Tax=Frankia sp. QA3 TaxID=710111 RepID=UPI0006853969|nr:acyl-CoA dehydrogenase family protein [Frankia sp. QA3]